MAKKWQVQSSPRSAKLYWSWEYGVRQSINLWNAHGTNTKAWLNLGDHSTKREAEAWATRIRIGIAYQEGRLGKMLTGGDVYVERTD